MLQSDMYLPVECNITVAFTTASVPSIRSSLGKHSIVSTVVSGCVGLHRMIL